MSQYSGVAVGVQFEGSSREEEVVCSAGSVTGGSCSVLNMACELCENSFEDDAHRNETIQTRESRQTLSHAHEKNCVCSSVRGICQYLQAKLLKIKTYRWCSSKMKLVRARIVNLSKLSISIAAILPFVVDLCSSRSESKYIHVSSVHPIAIC